MISTGSRNSVVLARRYLSTGGFWQGGANGTMPRTMNNVDPFKLRFIPKTAPTATEAASSDAQHLVKKPFKFIVSNQSWPTKEAGKSPKWSSYGLPTLEAIKSHEEVVRKQKQTIDQRMATSVAKSDCSCTEAPKKRKRKLRPRKALITLSPKAIKHLRGLLAQPEPKLIRVSARNRGCSGLTYDLQYITEPGKFDEVVEQDGVKIVIDSKALFSIIGSEMDWVDDKLASKFVFKNPNSKGTCGCGESFMV
ncbi:isa1p [Saccharomyces arboricola H-6]|uniref:Iron-sulfur assembly protein 1 n=1 Tax=Saccharomyces arboricola (strain H-6 / AS 2.3317 / CBS 10644) TaxID=1160507 RepID=J8Q5E3_SACAR|nr:isa1p [Saccharomyces arboricola H-6]